MHHLDKTDFQMQRNLRNRPSFHYKKYRLMLDPLIIIPFIKYKTGTLWTGILNKLIFRILWSIFGLRTDSFLH